MKWLSKLISKNYRTKDLPRPKPGDIITYRRGGFWIGTKNLVLTGVVRAKTKSDKEANKKYDRPFEKYGYIYTEPDNNMKFGDVVHPLEVIEVRKPKEK